MFIVYTRDFVTFKIKSCFNGYSYFQGLVPESSREIQKIRKDIQLKLPTAITRQFTTQHRYQQQLDYSKVFLIIHFYVAYFFFTFRQIVKLSMDFSSRDLSFVISDDSL